MVWEPSDIISAVSAFLLLAAIGVSLFLGIRSLRVANKIEEKKYKMGLLNELLDWGIDVLVCSQSISINEKSIEKYKEEGELEFANMRDITGRYSSLSNKAGYFKDNELNSTIHTIHELITLCHNAMLFLCRDEELVAPRILSKRQLELVKGLKKKKRKFRAEDLAGTALVSLQIRSHDLLEISNNLLSLELGK